ncbi:MAG TPA: TadE/TadG family type IV pilus assembly protein [Sphingomicrobium sp.]|nr:TadE/TadG family type IV pilus assembly protein [Sphingomicrobium sp.]
MTRLIRCLTGDRKGSAAIEFAVALPVLISMVWGMFQIGLIFQANAGMRHALGEAARYATIFPTPSDTQIQSMITSHKFGLGNGEWDDPVITDDTTAKTKTIDVSYQQQLDFLFFDGPTVTLTASKVIYLSA